MGAGYERSESDPRSFWFCVALHADVTLKTGILIVTYAKDIEFFKSCAKSIALYAKGFDWVKVVVPSADRERFLHVAEPCNIRVEGFDEEPDKGFLSHMRMKCYADHHFPDADWIFHLDADCVFARESTPQDWIWEDRALLPFRFYSDYLKTPIVPGEEANFMGFTGRRVDFERGQYFWKWATDFALGVDSTVETMQWMPLVHRREVYGAMRAQIAARHGITFDEYILQCRNEFPQTFCEFNALGTVAHLAFAGSYRWHQKKAERDDPHVGHVIQTWSHGGLDRQHDFLPAEGGRQTPRELFKRLSIL